MVVKWSIKVGATLGKCGHCSLAQIDVQWYRCPFDLTSELSSIKETVIEIPSSTTAFMLVFARGSFAKIIMNT